MRIAGKVITVTVALTAAAALSACTNSEQDSTKPPVTGPTGTPPAPSSTATSATTSSSAPSSATSAASATNAAAGAECKADDIKVDGAAGAKPTITLPTTCKPPSTLLVKDLTPGTGPAATAQNKASVNYLLETWSDKNIVDNSYDRGQPYDLQGAPIGQAQVVQGWQQGLVGITQGGRRLLVIPPNLGYGPSGRDPVKPNETLVFVIDTVSVS
jgi:peptidylprolyl isomerase